LQLTGEEQKIREAPPIFGIRPCNNIFLIQGFFKKVIPTHHELGRGKVHNLLITRGLSHCVAAYIKRYLGYSLQVIAQAKNGDKLYWEEKFHVANGKVHACS
jgi:hypothetical protein